jgi:hypothetical protein
MDWARFWATFSHTQLVTQFTKNEKKIYFYEKTLSTICCAESFYSAGVL